MIPFDPPENIRKANISYPLIRIRAYVCTDVYQGVRNVWFSYVFKGIKTEHLEEKGKIIHFCYYFEVLFKLRLSLLP